MSEPQLDFVFDHCVPTSLRGKVIVDIGSRLGPVLYYVRSYHIQFFQFDYFYFLMVVGSFLKAHLFSEAEEIVGIEMNAFFADLSRKMIEKYKMNDRVRVEQSDVRDQAALLGRADLVIMNNVFDAFLPVEAQVRFIVTCDVVRAITVNNDL